MRRLNSLIFVGVEMSLLLQICDSDALINAHCQRLSDMIGRLKVIGF